MGVRAVSVGWPRTEKTICDRSPSAVSVAHRPIGPIGPNPDATSHSILAGFQGSVPDDDHDDVSHINDGRATVFCNPHRQ